MHSPWSKSRRSNKIPDLKFPPTFTGKMQSCHKSEEGNPFYFCPPSDVLRIDNLLQLHGIIIKLHIRIVHLIVNII